MYKPIMIEIDGSLGEGGGQVLRSSLALSVLTHQAVRLRNIRIRRPKPGLAAQHLIAVEAAATICHAEVEGASLGSTRLAFTPGEVRPGTYRFEIPTAGATTLVLQTIFLPLCLAQASSNVAIGGGTHVPWSPCYHYLEQQWLPALKPMGVEARLELEQAGFYPQGGGIIQAVIQPVGKLGALHMTERGALLRMRGISAVANLDADIALRQKLQALRRLEPVCGDTQIETLDLPPAPSGTRSGSRTRGTFILLLAQFEKSQAAYFALGEPGKRAERVADEAVELLLEFLASDGAIDQFLADQLLLPLALGSGASEIRTSKVTQHLLTNAEVIRAFLPVKIIVDGEIGQPATVRMTP
jgi:RNA 3'-terminal phosphate cyclase (ATP)